MLDIKFIQQNPNKVKKGCKAKQVKVDIDRLLELDKKRREYLKETEGLRAEENRISYLVSKEIDPTKKDKLIKKAQEVKAKIRDYESRLADVVQDFDKLMLQIPNVPLEEVPIGKDEKDNVVLREVGEKTKFKFKPKDYLEIAQNLDLIDIKKAAKIAGTRFGYLKKEAALLEFALINLAFDTLTPKRFIPVIPPVIIKPEMAIGMGYPEQFNGEEAYHLEKDNLFLIATAEQALGTMWAGEIFAQIDLPQRYLGFSTCFRREAGAYGKDTRGIFRVHQFDKVEMFSFCKPEDSRKEHQLFLEMEEKLMQSLKIPYRVVQICTGDLGFPTAAKYDIEAWLPSQNRYRETHSTSNCTDFQARRLNIKYQIPERREGWRRTNVLRLADTRTKRSAFIHTVNGTAFAIGRTLIAIIENYQQKDGSIKVPEVLQRYLKFKVIS